MTGGPGDGSLRELSQSIRFRVASRRGSGGGRDIGLSGRERVSRGRQAPSICDTFAHTPGVIKNDDTGGGANNHYHRYRENVALVRDIGVTAYRFTGGTSPDNPDTGRNNRKETGHGSRR